MPPRYLFHQCLKAFSPILRQVLEPDGDLAEMTGGDLEGEHVWGHLERLQALLTHRGRQLQP